MYGIPNVGWLGAKPQQQKEAQHVEKVRNTQRVGDPGRSKPSVQGFLLAIIFRLYRQGAHDARRISYILLGKRAYIHRCCYRPPRWMIS